MTTYITNIGLLATPRGDSARRGRQQGEITLLRDAWVAVEGGKIAAVGQGQPAPEDGDTLLDAGGRLMTPGLVDAHTHLIFGGWRQNELGQKLRGYDDPDAVLTAVESRSSSPVRIPRDGTCQSSLRGLYPCGEGAGYAGGILSAAADGMHCAEQLCQSIQKESDCL